MLLSIIIPIYNAEKYIDRCISSVVNQTLKEIEIILINDGSKDESLLLCKEWESKDCRIKLFSQDNSGVSAARNLGIRKALGKYIMFLDSDDYMFPQMCEMMHEMLIKKNADCIICGTAETGGGLWVPEKNMDYISFDEFKKDFVYQLNTELLSPCWNKIFKKELITDHFREDISFGEDLIFCLDYFRNCNRISFITDALLFHEKDISGSLVSVVNFHRLLDIEKVHLGIIRFDSNTSVQQGLHNKYIKDITVYLRMFFLNKKLSIKEKQHWLNEWIKISFIGRIAISNISCCFSNKILLLLAKHRCWRCVNMLINKRVEF